jgi:ABC-2 type transport system ATP-binding protein
MVHRPEILILDEPTMGLDPVQILEIRDVIREAGRDRTVIFSTHILQEVPAVCSRIMVIHEGRLVADGGVDQVCGLAEHRKRLVARIKGPPDQIQAHLAELDAAAEVTADLDGEMGEYTVLSAQAEALRERVFRLVRDEDWELTELRLEKATLEEAFVHLTAPPAHRSGSRPANRVAS